MARDFDAGSETGKEPRPFGLEQKPEPVKTLPPVEKVGDLNKDFSDDSPTDRRPPDMKMAETGSPQPTIQGAKLSYEKTVNDLMAGLNDEGASVSSSLVQELMGSISAMGEYYFPPELIGGCCPRVAGNEQEIVWNAAAEACDSERIHVVWQARGDKIWYLAVRSSELASHPRTWCPFASLLPGMKDASSPPVCYTYYSDEAATMMTVSADGLQIHRGTASMMRAKADRTARSLDNAQVIELVPDRIEKLTPVPWFSLSLFEDRARRILAAFSVVGAISIAGLALFVWFVATMAMVAAHTDKAEIEARSSEKSLLLLQNVQAIRASPMREQLAKFAELNDGLLMLNGYLEIYQISKNKVSWRAVVPPNITSDRINDIGGRTLDTTQQGVVIGNGGEAASLGKKK